MPITTDITVIKAKRSKLHLVDFDNLEFGKYVADHMLVCDYAHGEWQEPSILPYSNLSMAPSALALHYGQTVFEGMKAFRTADGRVNIFRLERHYERFVRSLERMCMAVPPQSVFTEGLIKLIEIDNNWVPSKTGDSLYIRPFMYASEEKFGVKVSSQYRFIIFTGPVPTLYPEPIKVKVETDYIRAARGGTGFAKCGGNYGGAFLPTQIARDQGYDQVIWTDARENRWVEESGTMNLMFVIDGKLVTPPLSDSILDGVTRESLLAIAEDMGVETTERPVSVEELKIGFRRNAITEAFGAGTAAIIAPIRTININGLDYHLPGYSHESVSYRLRERLELIRTGRMEDIHDWNFIV